MFIAVRLGSFEAHVQFERSVQAQQRDQALSNKALSLAAAGGCQIRETPPHQSKHVNTAHEIDVRIVTVFAANGAVSDRVFNYEKTKTKQRF